MLRDEYNTLSNEYKTLNQATSERLCNSFAEAFYTKLPIELRDMVYAYLWTDEMLLALRRDRIIYNDSTGLPFTVSREVARPNSGKLILNPTPTSLPCAGKVCNCFKWSSLPNWMRHQYVGIQVAKEVVAAYYRAMPLEQLSIPLDRLRDVLLIDHFHLGVRPVDHIRRIKISLHDEDICHGVGWDCRRIDMTGMQMLKLNLSALLDVRLKSALKLSVHTTRPYALHFKYFPSLNVFRPIGIELKHAGAEIELIPKVSCDREIVGEDDEESSWATKVGKVLDLDSPSELWMNASDHRNLEQLEKAAQDRAMKAVADEEYCKIFSNPKKSAQKKNGKVLVDAELDKIVSLNSGNFGDLDKILSRQVRSPWDSRPTTSSNGAQGLDMLGMPILRTQSWSRAYMYRSRASAL
ncbi:hypothetical protein T440DRAFT_476800 [Plenodomus tracheiphilus IPT5]|uniref:Uncharacterized protein n=1 Tax=Plenodomus tracheiphilus IPT5 TaxID=1408161 RepID=A0A6A7BDS8_9PLEO|nr:hypothetical protein T440DRAFT_476800 [Plenodomus tracheiphilus IPT5]